MATIFLSSINCFARIKPILKLYEQDSSSKMIFKESWAPRARTYKNRTDKPEKMVRSRFLIKIQGIFIGNFILDNTDWDIINDHIHTNIIFRIRTE